MEFVKRILADAEHTLRAIQAEFLGERKGRAEELSRNMENILRVLPLVAENESLSPQQDFEIDEVIARIQSARHGLLAEGMKPAEAHADLPLKKFSAFIGADELHDIEAEEANALFDRCCADLASRGSERVRFQLRSLFRSGWREEAGHWLHTAQGHGYLSKLLQSDLAPAMVAHYCLHTAWDFVSWEPLCAGSADVDLVLRAPTGSAVSIIVKGPDQPGYLRSGAIEEGEYDQRVLRKIDNARRQLARPAQQRSMIVVCPQRNWPMRADRLATFLCGTTRGTGFLGGGTILPRSQGGTFFQRGSFFKPEWSHIGAVTHLYLIRGAEQSLYGCVVLQNPMAESRAAVDPRDFPVGSVCHLVGDTFHWTNGEPPCSSLPEGTKLVD